MDPLLLIGSSGSSSAMGFRAACGRRLAHQLPFSAHQSAGQGDCPKELYSRRSSARAPREIPGPIFPANKLIVASRRDSPEGRSVDPEDHQQIVHQHRAERAARFGRIKRWLKPLPRRSNLARYPVLRHFAAAARRAPHLWSFQRPAVRRAIYLGSIVAFQPIYGLHLLVALGAAIVLRANLAVTTALLFITNPLTAGPIYYAAYHIGIRMLQTFNLSADPEAIGARIHALILGGLVLGLAVALLADLVYQFAVWEATRLRQQHAAARERAAAAKSGRGGDVRDGKGEDLEAVENDRDSEAVRGTE